MADSSTLYTVGAYAALFGVGYAAYHVSTRKTRERAAASQAKSSKPQQAESRKEDKKKKQRLESFTSEAQGAAEKAAKAVKSNAAALTQELAPSVGKSQAKETNDEVDNREFARQLSKAKQGTQFTSNSDSGRKQKEKSVKQSQANKINPLADEEVLPVAPTSGINGADSAVESSPVASPAIEPTDTSGVADMLEPVAAGPSVLRLTGTDSKDNKQKKVAKAPEPVETKKQRQNRKKAEAAKAAREDAEKDRKTLEEKQRRAARLAEGRAAKDGSQFTAAAVKNSAWNQGAPNGGHTETSQETTSHQLLDTFEASAPAAAPAKVTATPKAESTWTSSLPSEEEQLEMLKDDADEWSTVTTKASKKTGKKEAPASPAENAPALARPAAQPKQTASINGAASSKSQNFGSFSALSTKDEPAEEVEEEWDV